VDKERLIILGMIGTRIDAQSFSKEVGVESSSHCLLGRDFNRWYYFISRWCSLEVLTYDGVKSIQTDERGEGSHPQGRGHNNYTIAM